MGVPLVEVMGELVDLSERFPRHPIRCMAMYLTILGGSILILTSVPTASPNEGGHNRDTPAHYSRTTRVKA